MGPIRLADWHHVNIARDFTYSALWMSYGAMLMVVGFWRRSAFVRWQALVLIAFTIGKVFLYDVSELDRGYRIVSFIVLGVLLLADLFCCTNAIGSSCQAGPTHIWLGRGMNRTGLVVAIVMALAKSVVPVPAISYFTNVRVVRLSQPGTQNYFVVYEEIWNHARPDLADLRIYDGESQVQYALNEQRGGISSHELPAKILNLGEVGGHTEFDLDMLDRRMGELGEYDRIRLELDAKDFVVTATIAGSNELASTAPALLPPATLYDFSREELGSNSVLKLPPTSFRYLHVKLSNGIRPSQVKSQTVFNLQETKDRLDALSRSSCGAPSNASQPPPPWIGLQLIFADACAD